MNDTLTIFATSEVSGEPIELILEDPYVIRFIRIKIHKTEIEELQEAMDCGEYELWPKEKTEARATIRDLKRELKNLERGAK